MVDQIGRLGIRCPVDDACVDDATCLACRLGAPRAGTHCVYPYEMLRGMMDGSGREAAHLSATMLGGICQRQTWLQQRTGYYVDPSKHWPALRGTIGHQLIEQYSEPGAIVETRFEIDLDGQRFTGQIDKFHPERKTLTDFKTKAESKRQPLEPQPEHVMQLNVYRWLLWHGWPQQPVGPYRPGEPARIPVDRMELVYWTFGWIAQLEVPTLEFSEVEEYIRNGLAVLTSEQAPSIPADLDPAGLRGKVSTFCQNWCPVRRSCLQLLKDEDHEF